MEDLDISGIKAANDLDIVPFDVPEWGGRIYLRPLANGDADIFSKVAGDGASGNKPGYAMAMTLSLMMCNAKGVKIWNNPADGAKVLQEKNNAVVQKIFNKAMEVAGNKASVEETGKG